METAVTVFIPNIVESTVLKIPIWQGDQIYCYQIDDIDTFHDILGVFTSETHAFRKLLEYCLNKMEEDVLEERMNDPTVLQMLEIMKEERYPTKMQRQASIELFSSSWMRRLVSQRSRGVT